MPDPESSEAREPGPVEKQPPRGLAVKAVISAGLAVICIGAAVAAVQQSSGDAAEKDIEYIDLTAGREPFDPAEQLDYVRVTWHDLAWVPPLPEAWKVEYVGVEREPVWTWTGDQDSSAMAGCGEIGVYDDSYPDSFDDPEGWYEADLERENHGTEYEVTADPVYTHYLIDGSPALLIEARRHVTQVEHSDGVHEVDWDVQDAHLYVDLPSEATPGRVRHIRCRAYSRSDDPSHYETAVEAILGIRLWLE